MCVFNRFGDCDDDDARATAPQLIDDDIELVAKCGRQGQLEVYNAARILLTKIKWKHDIGSERTQRIVFLRIAPVDDYFNPNWPGCRRNDRPLQKGMSRTNENQGITVDSLTAALQRFLVDSRSTRSSAKLLHRSSGRA